MYDNVRVVFIDKIMNDIKSIWIVPTSFLSILHLKMEANDTFFGFVLV